jgi:hypothetical protein
VVAGVFAILQFVKVVARWNNKRRLLKLHNQAPLGIRDRASLGIQCNHMLRVHCIVPGKPRWQVYPAGVLAIGKRRACLLGASQWFNSICEHLPLSLLISSAPIPSFYAEQGT